MPLIFSALVTLFFAVVLYYLDKRTNFGNLPSYIKQTVYGICFGFSAAFATEFGSFNLFGAAVNCRDAAPITAGLIFGPWAGILAGILGAIDRYFIATPFFGIGAYTQIACAIATLFAGCFAALFKVTVFKNHRALTIHAFVFVLVTEVVHMCLVPLTHLDDIENATMVVYNTFIYLLLANLLVVTIVFAITSYMHQRFEGNSLKDMLFKRDLMFENDLFYSFQFWLLVILFVAFGAVFFLVAGSHEVNSMLTTQKSYQNELEALKDSINADAARTNANIEDTASKIVKDWSYGETVVYEVADQNNNIVGTNFSGHNFAKTSVRHPENTLYYETVDGTVYYIMYTNFDNLKLSLAITEKYEMFLPHFITMVTSFLLIFVFGMLMLAVFKLLRKIVGENLGQLNESLDKLSKGEFDEEVRESTLNQFSELSQKINRTVNILKEDIEKEAQKYSTEFEMAHEIQISSLPSVFPAFPDHPEIDVYARYRSAREVGGDFYDYYYVGPNKICFVIADVSGKGIPAAMFMMRAKSALMMFARNSQDPAKTLYETNNYLCENNIADMFVTAWVGILDISTGHLVYATAGHNPPIVLDEQGNSHQVDAPVSLVLGGLPDIKYKNNEGTFAPGQILFLYTDGVTEANDAEGQLFGEIKLIKTLNSVAGKNVKEICDSVVDSVDAFAVGAEQFDDITTLAIKYQPPINNKKSED